MKQVRPVLILFVLLFLANTLQAQTTKNLHYPTPKYPELFKTIPLIDSETPKWAVAMYGENPNVYQVVEMYRDYYKTHKFVKTIHTQNFKHWQWRVEEYIDAEGFIEMPDQKTEERQSKRLKERFEARQEANHSLKKTGASSEWYSMGPFETYKQNTTQPVSIHKNIYSIDQSESNPDLLICGTEAGGVFKSTDKGLNWSLTNKSENFVGGNGAVKIHPTNANVFLVASNSRIYRSTDGGTTWNEEHYMGAGGYEFRFHPVQTDIIFCAASNGLYRSDNGGDTWAKIFSERCWDIDFHPTDEEVIYLLKTNSTAKRAEVFRSDDTGATWTLKDNGYFSPSDLATASDGGGKIAVSAAAGAADIVYVCLIGAGKAADGGWVGVYKSTDKGENWVNPSGQDGAPEEGYGSINGETMWNVAAYSGGYHQGFYNFDFEVSDTDADVLWIATIRLTESADGGATFTSIGAANSQRLSDIHADVQDLEVNGGDIWVATDGGLNFSDDELMTHDSRKKGISASHFWGFNTGWNEDVFTGGRYHDGTIAYYEGYGLGNVHHVGGVEEPSGYVHPVESRKVYYRTHYASDYTSVKTVPTILGETTIGHSSLPLYPNESYSTSRSSGLYFHPSYADHLFMGRGNSIFKSTNGGSNFDTLYTFPAGAVYEIEISRNNPDIIYTVFKPNGQQCLIYKTLDAGETWTSITNPPANTNRLEISLNPANDHELWVALGSGSNGEMVYKTLNGGLTWQNMTTPTLDGEDTQDIYYQGGTNDVVYVATHNTLFQYDAAANEWIDYGNGLPMIAKVLKIRPFYRDAELRLGSYGRGVWGREMADTNFTPIAQPITYRDSVFCAQDNVQFDCYS
ncbi:MAG: WD40/YVTN/BNR-like repeat-containing protein, partial [Chitinophagales bacterium]